jgi:diketogulonate reductase-like aldo/keto reductase
MYGTAWKEERTEGFVAEALAAGFRAIDTANQRKHYHEAAVGKAIGAALRSGLVTRDALFLQTKFTYVEGQDARLPFDPKAALSDQVRQSLKSSFEHLGVSRIDSFLLHGPRTRRGLMEGDREVWRTMEELQREGSVGAIGASNVTAEQIATLCDFAGVAPAFVQNRCYARFGWDREAREVCRANGITYQGFSLLTANAAELRSARIAAIAKRHDRTVAQVVFAFAIAVGMLPLTGTTDPRHMREDLAASEIELSADEITEIETISG